MDDSHISNLIREEIKKSFREELDNLRKVIHQELSEVVSKAVREEFTTLRKQIDEQNNRIQEQSEQLSKLQDAFIKSEEQKLKAHRNELACNLIIRGVAEFLHEDKQKTMSVASELLSTVCSNIKLVKAERIGKPHHERPRIIKVTVGSKEIRNTILREARNKRETTFKDIYLDADRTPLDQKESYRLRQKQRDLRAQYPNSNIIIRRGKLLVDDTEVDCEQPLRHILPID